MTNHTENQKLQVPIQKILFVKLFDAIAADVGLKSALLFGVIWYQCQRQSRACWESHESMGKTLGVSKRSIVTLAEKLIAADLIQIAQKNKGGKTNVYTLAARADSLIKENDNFTVVYHEDIAEHGAMLASVFCAVKRIVTRSETGMAEFTQKEIAGMVGVGHRTAERSIATLRTAELITDMTPNTKAKGHLYTLGIYRQNFTDTPEQPAKTSPITRQNFTDNPPKLHTKESKKSLLNDSNDKKTVLGFRTSNKPYPLDDNVLKLLQARLTPNAFSLIKHVTTMLIDDCLHVITTNDPRQLQHMIRGDAERTLKDSYGVSSVIVTAAQPQTAFIAQFPAQPMVLATAA